MRGAGSSVPASVGGGGDGAISINAIDSSGFTQVRAHYDFDGVMTDASGNDYHLKSNQDETYATLDGKKGLFSREATLIDEVAAAGSSTLLQITTAVTVHSLMFFQDQEPGSGGGYVFIYGGPVSDASEAINFLYSLEIEPSGLLNYLHESGVGTNREFNVEFTPPVGRWSLLSVTKDSAGTDVNVYWDGQLLGNQTVAAVATGGTTAEVQIMEFMGFIGGLVISEEEQTPTEVLAVAQQVGVVT